MFKKFITLLLTVTMLMSVLCSCTDKTAKDKKEEPVSKTAEDEKTDKTDSKEAKETPIDINAPYSPAITVDYVLPTEAVVNFMDGESWEDNCWTRFLEEQRGIKMNLVWSTPPEHYDEKVALTISSGELPDMMRVNYKDYLELAGAGKLEPLTDVYNDYASDLVKGYMDEEPYIEEGLNVDGEMYGIPASFGFGDSISFMFLYIRQDWLDNLGLKVPENFEDLKKVAVAFTENDPDGNGEKDTYGLCLNKDLIGNVATCNGLMMGYGAYPDIWLEKDGELVYGGIQDETKKALLFMQELYKAGVVDP